MMDSRTQEILEVTKGPRVLDVGCVGGLQGVTPNVDSPWWLHRHLLDTFDDVWGIDLSPARIDLLRAAGIPNVFAADAQQFDLDATFDSIVAGELIEHLPNPGAFLANAARHLAPGGRIVITTPYVHGIEYLMYSWLRYPKTCPNPEHTCWVCPTTLAMLADLTGLHVRSWKLLRDDRKAEGWGPYDLALRGQRVLNRILPTRIMGKTVLAVLEQIPQEMATANAEHRKLLQSF